MTVAHWKVRKHDPKTRSENNLISINLYRSHATFDQEKMKLFLYSPEFIEIAEEAYRFLETNPAFKNRSYDLSMEEQRQLTYQRMKEIYASTIFYPDDYYFNMKKAHWLNCILGSYDWSLLARKGLLKDFAISGIYGLGTEKHYPYISSILNMEIGFAFCLTEISHGTNSKALRTEARYDVSSKSFVLNTPDFEAAKCWAGCLGKTASHCLVFAQLITPDDVCHGLHCFIVPVRDRTTLLPFQGVKILDMGPKLGLNGLDNGVVMFDHYTIPKDNLLNKTGDVTDEGVYVTPFKDSNKRFGASLGNLSHGRLSIIGFSLVNLRKSLTIAIRYSAVRRQFGPENAAESPILEYPLQQWRLFPYLAATYCLHVCYFELIDEMSEFHLLLNKGEDPALAGIVGQEIHAICSAGKPVSSWLARDAIQECREACGGHGYLRAAGFGQLRDDNDANCTYEGDNNVLLQQTSNWLVSCWRREASSPLGTCPFLQKRNSDGILRRGATSFNPRLSDEDISEMCLRVYEELIVWLCRETLERRDREMSRTGSAFEAKNRSQVYGANSLSVAYFEQLMISRFMKSIRKQTQDNLTKPLWRLCALFALTRLRTHTPLLIQGGVLELGKSDLVIRDLQCHVTRLLGALLPDAVALVDAIAPSDFVLGSVLGMADGKVYEHLQRSMEADSNAFCRDSNWEQMKYSHTTLKSKI